MKWSVDELLSILDEPEESQKIHCVIAGFIDSSADEETGAAYLTESLAETAFRMRNEVIEESCEWLEAVCEVIEHCEGQEYCKECGQKHKTKKYFNWGEQAQPIHWIIAALIARKRKEEEIN